MDYVEVKPKKVQKQNSFPIESSLRSATSSTPSRRGLQMARGEREGWEVPLHLLYHHHDSWPWSSSSTYHHHQHQVPLHPLSLEECGASSSACLLASLATEPGITNHFTAKGDLSNLSIAPERVAKVMKSLEEIRLFERQQLPRWCRTGSSRWLCILVERSWSLQPETNGERLSDLPPSTPLYIPHCRSLRCHCHCLVVVVFIFVVFFAISAA